MKYARTHLSPGFCLYKVSFVFFLLGELSDSLLYSYFHRLILFFLLQKVVLQIFFVILVSINIKDFCL